MENSKKPLQAVFFDFDGVIVDSTSTKTAGFRTLFADYDDDTVTRVLDYHKEHGGISRVEKIRHAHQNILGIPLTETELADWAARYSQLVVEKVITVELIAGAGEFLDEMLGKVPIFIVSGTPEDELRYILKRRELSGYFAKAVGSPVKKPVHIRNLIWEYELDSTRCVFIGDALTDYNAAKECGMAFVGIKGEVEFPAGVRVLDNCKDLMEELLSCFIVS